MILEKRNRLRIILIVLIFIAIVVLGIIGLSKHLSSNKNKNTIEVVQLDFDTKKKTGDYLVLINALYQKSLQTSKSLNESVSLFEQGKLSQTELSTVIARSNKQLTYYYLVSIQNSSPDTTKDVSKDMTYQLYLMRRGSEELLKFLKDQSTLRLAVGQDLLAQAITKEDKQNTLIGTNIAKYAIDTKSVVLDETIWDKEYKFVSQQPDLVIFKDLDSAEMAEYAYYLKTINDSFMLVSWEMENIYLAKVDFTQQKISSDQLGTDLEKSGYVITNIYDQLQTIKAPKGLEKLDSDTKKTITLYRDALLELEKYRMNKDLKHFDNAMIYIDQADLESSRIGEFIYSVRYQYGFYEGGY